MSKGWIKLHRQIMDHPFYEEERTFSKYEAWEYLLLNANHSDNKTLIDGKMVVIERGSFITSIRKLQDRWKWSNTKAVSFLDLLESEKMITKKSDTKKTLITIDMYDFYQGEGEEKRHENDTKTIQKHTNKNDKELKNDKEVKKEDEKIKHLDFVFLTEKQYLNLINVIGSDNLEDLIFELNAWLANNEKKRKTTDCNLTLQNWNRRRIKERSLTVMNGGQSDAKYKGRNESTGIQGTSRKKEPWEELVVGSPPVLLHKV